MRGGTIGRSVVFVVLAACSGDGSPTAPPPDTRPASVAIVSATWRGVYTDGERITISLRNDGGPGFFKLGASATSSSTPGGALADFGTSEPFEVAAGWAETADFTIDNGNKGTTQRVGRLVIYSRGKESISYEITSEYVFK